MAWLWDYIYLLYLSFTFCRFITFGCTCHWYFLVSCMDLFSCRSVMSSLFLLFISIERILMPEQLQLNSFFFSLSEVSFSLFTQTQRGSLKDFQKRDSLTITFTSLIMWTSLVSDQTIIFLSIILQPTFFNQTLLY